MGCVRGMRALVKTQVIHLSKGLMYTAFKDRFLYNAHLNVDPARISESVEHCDVF